MKLMVFTDLDGTLLEPDGSLAAAVAPVMARLRRDGVPVVPLTSKTRVELTGWLAGRDAGGVGAFENGAAILWSRGVDVLPGAVPVARLRSALAALAREAGLSVTTLDVMSDAEIAERTGLPASSVARARSREYDLPFLSEGDVEAVLGPLLPRDLRVVRGDRFWHLSGDHGKEDAFWRILATNPSTKTVGLGDAPNDAGFLGCVDRAVIVPRPDGADERLRALVPHAAIAPRPGGAGWADAVSSILDGEEAAR